MITTRRVAAIRHLLWPTSTKEASFHLAVGDVSPRGAGQNNTALAKRSRTRILDCLRRSFASVLLLAATAVAAAQDAGPGFRPKHLVVSVGVLTSGGCCPRRAA